MAASKVAGQATKLNTATREANAGSAFVTKGVDFTPDMLTNNSTVRSIYNDYLVATNGNAVKARELTTQAVQSGIELPAVRFVGSGEELVRLIPVGNEIEIGSFYMSRSTYGMLIGTGKNAQQVADALGLPASSYAGGGFRGFQALSIQPQPGRLATAYESTIAPVQQGAYQATGGLRQLIVPNAKDFTAPKPIPGGFIPVAGVR